MIKKQISEKQLVANRANAKKGGVKSYEGKQKSKMNALTHGLTASCIVDDGEKVLFQIILDELVQDKKPVGFIEYDLIENIAYYYVKLKRVIHIETRYVKLSKMESIQDFYNGYIDSHQQDPYDIASKGDMILSPNFKKVTKHSFEKGKEIAEAKIHTVRYTEIKNMRKIQKYEGIIENRLYKLIDRLEKTQKARLL